MLLQVAYAPDSTASASERHIAARKGRPTSTLQGDNVPPLPRRLDLHRRPAEATLGHALGADYAAVTPAELTAAPVAVVPTTAVDGVHSVELKRTRIRHRPLLRPVDSTEASDAGADSPSPPTAAPARLRGSHFEVAAYPTPRPRARLQNRPQPLDLHGGGVHARPAPVSLRHRLPSAHATHPPPAAAEATTTPTATPAPLPSTTSTEMPTSTPTAEEPSTTPAPTIPPSSKASDASSVEAAATTSPSPLSSEDEATLRQIAALQRDVAATTAASSTASRAERLSALQSMLVANLVALQRELSGWLSPATEAAKSAMLPSEHRAALGRSRSLAEPTTTPAQPVKRYRRPPSFRKPHVPAEDKEQATKENKVSFSSLYKKRTNLPVGKLFAPSGRTTASTTTTTTTTTTTMTTPEPSTELVTTALPEEQSTVTLSDVAVPAATEGIEEAMASTDSTAIAMTTLAGPPEDPVGATGTTPAPEPADRPELEPVHGRYVWTGRWLLVGTRAHG